MRGIRFSASQGPSPPSPLPPQGRGGLVRQQVDLEARHRSWPHLDDDAALDAEPWVLEHQDLAAGRQLDGVDGGDAKVLALEVDLGPRRDLHVDLAAGARRA